jgi:hypothetical protein
VEFPHAPQQCVAIGGQRGHLSGFRTPEKAIPMPADKAPNTHGGAPAAKKPSEGERFDLFRTFRHPPKPAEPSRTPKASSKPKE